MLKKLFFLFSFSIFTVFIGSCVKDPSNEDLIPVISDAGVDSLFNVMVTKVELLEDIEDYDEFYALEFKDMSTAFNNYLNKNPGNIKANTGYIVSSILALNKSQSMKMLADSLDSYFSSFNDKSNDNLMKRSGCSIETYGNGFLASKITHKTRTKNFMRRSLDKNGLNGLSIALSARTPELISTQAVTPSYPKFITVSFLQNIAQNEIIPALDNVITAFQRLEAIDTMKLIFNIDNKEVEIDLGEIFIADAGIHLLRAQLLMYCTYDMDLFKSSSEQNYSWIDDIANFDFEDIKDTVRYTLLDDTLFINHIYNNEEFGNITSNLYKYNLQRPGFLTIKSNNHTKAYADYLAVPALIKSAIAYIKNEGDSQNNDLIPKLNLDSISGNMAEMPQKLIDQGFSVAFANNFKTPESFMDFITAVLSGPYTINETIDSFNVQITVNLSKFFTDPMQDLRTYMPKYKFREDGKMAERIMPSTPVSFTYRPGSLFTINNDSNIINIISINPSFIDSIVESSPDKKIVYLNTPFKFESSKDTVIISIPYDLVNESNEVIPYNTIQNLIKNKTFLPVFNDYTFNGIFPEMTRQKWLDLIYQ